MTSRGRSPASRSAWPGSRCRRRPASRPGSAARTGRRRTGCRGPRWRPAGTCRSPVTSSPHELGALDRDLGERALARRVGRPPAPQDVLGVEDQQVAAADGEEPRRRDRARRAAFWPDADDDRRLLGLEVDPVDGLRRAVEHVRRAVRARGPARRGRSAAPSAGLNVNRSSRADRDDAVQPVQARDRPAPGAGRCARR